MGRRGPVPKTDAERRRTNVPVVATQVVRAADIERVEFVMPEVPDYWHPVAKKMFEAFEASLMRVFYEPTDWMLAYTACEDLSRELVPRPMIVGTDEEGEPIYEMRYQPLPGAKLSAFLKVMSSLLATEGDRRRLQIELAKDEIANAGAEEPADIVSSRSELFVIDGGAAS